MNLASFRVLVAVCVVIIGHGARAQDLSIEERGLKPFGSFAGGNLDSINMGNGSLTLHIPFWSFPQRGNSLRLNYFLSFTSNDWELGQICPHGQGCSYNWHFTGVCGPADHHGCAYGGGVSIKNDLGIFVTAKDVKPDQNHDYTIFAAHRVSGQVVQLGIVSTDTYRSFDGSGLLYRAGNIYDPNGNYSISGSPTTYDSNGNYITNNMSPLNMAVTDTLGRTIPGQVATSDPSDLAQCDNSPRTLDHATAWSLPADDPNGNASTARIIFCYVIIHMHRDSYNGGVNDRDFDKDFAFIQQIALPNGTKWKFEYQDNEGNLTKVSLPTGGSISYTWLIPGQLSSCASGQRGASVSTRTVDAGDGSPVRTWTYSWGGATNINTVTDPELNDTVYTMGQGCSAPLQTRHMGPCLK